MTDPHHKTAMTKLATALRLSEHAAKNRAYTGILEVMDSFRDDVENLGGGRHNTYEGVDWDKTLSQWIDLIITDHQQ